MLHELHVIEVDDTRVVLVHRVDLGHFVVGEAEVEVSLQNNGNSKKSEFRFFWIMFQFWEKMFLWKAR